MVDPHSATKSFPGIHAAVWDHDGKPVTVEDVIFSFRIMKEKGAPSFRFYYGNVETVEATAERTVRLGDVDALGELRLLGEGLLDHAPQLDLLGGGRGRDSGAPGEFGGGGSAPPTDDFGDDDIPF